KISAGNCPPALVGKVAQAPRAPVTRPTPRVSATGFVTASGTRCPPSFRCIDVIAGLHSAGGADACDREGLRRTRAELARGGSTGRLERAGARGSPVESRRGVRGGAGARACRGRSGARSRVAGATGSPAGAAAVSRAVHRRARVPRPDRGGVRSARSRQARGEPARASAPCAARVRGAPASAKDRHEATCARGCKGDDDLATARRAGAGSCDLASARRVAAPSAGRANAETVTSRAPAAPRSEEHTSELQSRENLV